MSKLKAGEAVIRVEGNGPSDLLVVSGNGCALSVSVERPASNCLEDN